MINPIKKSQFFFVLTLFLNFISCNLAPGSYPYAEQYQLDVTESNLVNAIEKFKSDHPHFNPPKELGFNDGRINEKDLWYHVYFYYPDEKQIIKTWIRTSLDSEKTFFALVAVNNGNGMGNWKFINHDFSPSENETQKEKFEESILNPIKAYLFNKIKQVIAVDSTCIPPCIDTFLINKK